MASQLTKIIANFSTQITSNVSVGGLTASLATNLDKEGNAMPAGKYCFTINQGKSNEQHFLCDLAGTALTNVQGVDHSGDVTTGFLKEARINDEIKITDYVNLLRIVEILSGEKALDGGTPLKYDTAPALTDPRQIPDKAYTDTVLNSKAGVADDNNFTGVNSFSQSPNIPDATTSNQPVTLAQLMAAALVGIQAGFENVDIAYNTDNTIRSIHDNINGKTYVLEYDSNGKVSGVYDGSKRTQLTTVDGRFISKVTN
jgi:hypothetical protein